MRLGLDGRALHGQLTGVGNWTWHLLRRIPCYVHSLEVFVYLPKGLTYNVPPELGNVGVRKNRAIPMLSGHFWVKYRSIRLIKHDDLDVYLAPRTLYPYGIEKYVPVVTVVHDLNVIIQPSSMSRVNYFAHRLWFLHDVNKAQMVVCNSHATSQRMYEATGRAGDVIVRPGVDSAHNLVDASAETARPHQANEPYILYVGTLEARKNISVLIDAHRDLNLLRQRKINLLLVGKRGWRTGNLFKLLDRGLPNVYELGYVTVSELEILYNNALTLVLPSHYEGFGMPAAEALACGTHAVVTDIPELREATDGHGIYVPPTAAGILSGIQLALNLPPAAAHHPLSWEDSAELLAGALQSATGISTRRGNR